MASDHLDDVERLLDERGHSFASGRLRVAAGNSGVAIGFPRRPMIHVSWWVVAGTVAVVCARRRQRR
jgi:hypothetical protein